MLGDSYSSNSEGEGIWVTIKHHYYDVMRNHLDYQFQLYNLWRDSPNG